MTREEVLQAAAKCVNGDRQEDYGSPENNFGLVAAFWNAYLRPCMRPNIIGVEPDKSILLYEPAQARQAAAISEKEVLYLCSRLDEMREKASAGLSSLAAERDRIEKTDPPSIMRDATLKVLEERIQRQIGYCNGLSDVWRLLHQRAYELWELTRLKDERT